AGFRRLRRVFVADCTTGIIRQINTTLHSDQGASTK
ncbi:hypothetical protein pipiens_007383, partial [Culex pipiens pipiens]